MTIQDICMVLYLGSDSSVQTASECLEDRFPAEIHTDKTLQPRAWKLRNIGHENHYQPIHYQSLGKPYTLQSDGNIDIILAKDCQAENSPIVFYSNENLTPQQLNQEPWTEFVSDLEKRLPTLYEGAVQTEEGHTATAKVLIENGSMPSVIYSGEKQLYPGIETNQTCLYPGGVFERTNGEYKGNPGKIARQFNNSADMVMLPGTGDSATVYMPKDMDLTEIMNPGSYLSQQIGSMYEQLRKT